MKIPDYMPVLSYGSHFGPKDGACVLEAVSFIAGEQWSDHPACVHPVIGECARMVNDSCMDEQRHKLIPLIPRLINTHDLRDEGSTGRGLLTKNLGDWLNVRLVRTLRKQGWDREANQHEVIRLRVTYEWTTQGPFAESAFMNECPSIVDWSRNQANQYVENCDDGETDVVPILVGLLDYHAKLVKRGVTSRLPKDRLKALQDARVE